MRLYHYTNRTNLHNILRDGLKPGSETEQGEQLNFVMLSNEKPDVKVGNVIHFEVEVDDDDPRLVKVNKAWFEYHGSISAHRLISLANPPANVDKLVELVQNHGTASVEYKTAFDFLKGVKI